MCHSAGRTHRSSMERRNATVDGSNGTECLCLVPPLRHAGNWLCVTALGAVRLLVGRCGRQLCLKAIYDM